MARTGKITLKQGTGKDSGKPYTALLLEVGSWSTLYFPKSQFEMDYIVNYLNSQEEDGKIELTDDDTPPSGKKKKGLFD